MALFALATTALLVGYDVWLAFFAFRERRKT